MSRDKEQNPHPKIKITALHEMWGVKQHDVEDKCLNYCSKSAYCDQLKYNIIYARRNCKAPRAHRQKKQFKP